jgi:hypothetical protein
MDLFDADVLPGIRRMCCVMRYRNQTQSGVEGIRAFHQLLPGHKKELLDIEDAEFEKLCKTVFAECGDNLEAMVRFATELNSYLRDIAAWHILAGPMSLRMLTGGPLDGLHLVVLHLVVEQSMSRATGGEELLGFSFVRDGQNRVKRMKVVCCGGAGDPGDDALFKYFTPVLNPLCKLGAFVCLNAMRSNGILEEVRADGRVRRHLRDGEEGGGCGRGVWE